jgi:uncharacterized membrane protein
MSHKLVPGPTARWSSATATPSFDLERLVGTILLTGILSSLIIILAAVLWQWATTGQTQFEPLAHKTNLLQFFLIDLRQVAAGPRRPKLLLKIGIALIMLTPYTRVLASLLYFALKRNWKYTLFTAVVFIVLSYSLFLR